MLARVVVAAVLFMTLANQIACQTTPVTGSESLNATQGINSNTTFTPAASATGLPQAVFYYVSWNVSEATSVNVTVDIYVNDELKDVAHSTGEPTLNPASLISSTSGLVNPCVSTVSETSSVVVNFNAATDGVSGEATLTTGTVEIPAIQNATAFDFKCGAETILGVSCVFYYTIQVNVTEGETLFLWAHATSAADVSVFAGDVCTGDVYTLGATTPTLLTNATSNTTLWVAVNATSSLAMPQLTFTWLSTPVPPPVAPNAEPLAEPTAPVTTEPAAPSAEEPQAVPLVPNAPIALTPSTAPSGDNNNELPTWATALLIVFGLLVAVLLIVVIVMCVKNRRRAAYNTV